MSTSLTLRNVTKSLQQDIQCRVKGGTDTTTKQNAHRERRRQRIGSCGRLTRSTGSLLVSIVGGEALQGHNV